MKPKNKYKIVLILAIISLLLSNCKSPDHSGKAMRNHLFNSGWKFIRDSISGAEQPGYDDSGWQIVDLPHDWSIKDLPGEDGPDQIGPFSKKSPGGGRATGHTIGGTGWYRKRFILDETNADKTVILKFDGVYMETEVWVNGKRAGIHKYGYTPFWFDITALLNPAGVTNLIAVKVENIGQNTRWYSGSGIYRNVHLILTHPVHMSVWGVYITTPEIAEDLAVADIAATIQNDGANPASATITTVITDSGGQAVAETNHEILLDAKETKTINKRINIENPDLWSLESPNIYQAEITIRVNDEITDTYIQSFGIRYIDFSVENGFLLNGEPVLIKGASLHHDNGLLGAAAINRAEERRVEIMKANGYNAIRCAHNPPSEAFLDACDRIGMLVIDEFTDIWEAPKNPKDYSRFFTEWWEKDMTDMILRDRNHPSIIMWSIGNEILEKNDTSGLRIGKQLADRVRELDDTRPVTEAINDNWQRRGQEWDLTAPAFALLDVGGYNYESKWMESDHEKYPDRIMYGSESFPVEAFDYWQPAEKHSYVIGDFVWTGMDYLGEVALGRSRYVPANRQDAPRMGMPSAGAQPPSGIYPQEGPPAGGASPAQANPPSGGPPSGGLTPDMATMIAMYRSSSWPWFGAWCGDIDITGEKKPQMLYRDVLWNNSELEVNVHAPVPEGQTEHVSMWGWPDEWPGWTWPGSEGKILKVRVFTKADLVRLELNGETVGEKEVSTETKYIASFDVPYVPGELKAVAYKNGNETVTKILKTAGQPAAIRLIADRNEIYTDRNDLAFVKIEVVDEKGQLIPRDSIIIKLTLTGNGKLVASGNASPYDMGSFNRPEINTYKGRAQAIIRPFAAGKKIVLKAESEGLIPAKITIRLN